MLSLDRHSLEQFIENPDDFVLRKHQGKIYAEKKGAWTWIKSHVLDRQSYNLQKIVPYLRDREDVSQKLQETVDKKIEQFNQKFEVKGRKIVPLKIIENSAQKASQASKGRVFFGEQKTLQFNVNTPPKNIATQKPLNQELKDDRGINPTDRKLRKLHTASIKKLLHRFSKMKPVSEKQMIDAFDKDCHIVLKALGAIGKVNSREVENIIAPCISQAYSQAVFAFASGNKKWDFEAFLQEVLSNLKTILNKPAEEENKSIKDAFLRYLKQAGVPLTPEGITSISVKRHEMLLNLFFSQKH